MCEEQQRVLGFLPNYYVSYDPHAVPLTTKQKFKLAWRSNVDPFSWLMVNCEDFAGSQQQATNSLFKGYGQGHAGGARKVLHGR